MIVSKKRWILAMFVVFVILTSNVAVYADHNASGTKVGIQPFWKNTSCITACLSITNGKAVLSTVVEGYSGVDRITAVAVLERLNENGTYTEIERWNNLNSDSWELCWTATRYVTKEYTYRFTITATVYKNGEGETVSGSKSTVG